MDTGDERTKRDDELDDRSAKGDVLGISRVPAGGVGEVHAPLDRGERAAHEDDEGRVTALEDEVDLGARDVTKSSGGQTGPETGGHGSTPQRSGATGMDIG